MKSCSDMFESFDDTEPIYTQVSFELWISSDFSCIASPQLVNSKQYFLCVTLVGDARYVGKHRFITRIKSQKFIKYILRKANN